MPKARVLELTDIDTRLPNIVQFESATQVPEHSDLLLCALGFEPRCLSFLEALADQGHTVTTAVFCRYSTNRADNEANEQPLAKALGRMSADVRSLEADDAGFRTQLRQLLMNLPIPNSHHLPKVLVDTSVMANRLIMRVMHALLAAEIDLHLLYSEAAIYHPTLRDYETHRNEWNSDAWLALERGIGEVSLSEDYPGSHLDQLPDCLLLFPSFRRDRSAAAIAYVDPSPPDIASEKVVWFLGKPHHDHNNWRLQAMKEINQIGDNTLQYHVSTFDYKESLRKLEDIYRQRAGNFKLWLCPMGSKMQAVGAALFGFLHPDVAAIVATPKEYNAGNYSDGCAAKWVVDFGSTVALRQILNQIGTLTVSD